MIPVYPFNKKMSCNYSWLYGYTNTRTWTIQHPHHFRLPLPLIPRDGYGRSPRKAISFVLVSYPTCSMTFVRLLVALSFFDGTQIQRTARCGTGRKAKVDIAQISIPWLNERPFVELKVHHFQHGGDPWGNHNNVQHGFWTLQPQRSSLPITICYQIW